MSEIKRALTAKGVDTSFWGWFATSLQTVAGMAYHRGWMDRELIADNPDVSFPPEDWHREMYTGTGFEPEYVATLYSPPLGFTRQDVECLRDNAIAMRTLGNGLKQIGGAEVGEEAARALDDLADRIAALLRRARAL